MNQSTLWILYLVVFVGIFYFLMYRPQMQRQKEQAALMSALAEGDKVITAGGIYGTVRIVGDDTVDVEIADGVVVTMAKQAIARKREA